MKGKKLQKLATKVRYYSPTILTGFGIIGVIATATLAVKATPKAVELIKEDSRRNHDGQTDASTGFEIVRSCWVCYIPAVAAGTATILCIVGANVLNRRQQASLVSAYALINRSFQDYKGKVKEIYGQEAHNKVLESLAVEKSTQPPITSVAFFSSSSLGFEDANEEEHLFYDSFSSRYFQSTISQVLQAEYHLNRNFALMGGFVPLNQFYEFLGIEPLKEATELGWWVDDDLFWIDFDHSKAILDEGLQCYIIDMVFMPTSDPPD